MTGEEQIQDAYDTYYDDTWDEHGGKAMVIDGYHDIWFPSCATNDFFKAGAEWADKAMLDKVCQYLFENYHGEKLSLGMIEDLRKAMEEQ